MSRGTVVHLITRLELGGAQENTLYTCQHLDRSRYRVVLVYGPGGLLDREARASSELQCVEVPELVREISPRRDARAFQKLSAMLADLRFEHARLGLDPAHFVVHTHSSKAGILGRLAARRAGVPCVVHGIHGFGFHHGQARSKRALFINAERLAGRLTDAFVSVSESNLREARDLSLIPAGVPCEVIRSGMPLEPFAAAPARQEARRQLEWAADSEIVLSVANFKPQKDPMTMVSAFSHLAARRPKAQLVYAGDGPLRSEVEAALRTLPHGDRVRLIGWRRDIPRLMAGADVVALSSIFEGLPRSAVQAVAARRPFVGTDVNGTAEIIRDGKNGFLVPPRDRMALAEALERALDLRPVDPDDQTRVQAWAAETMVRSQEQLYARLLDTPSEGRAVPA